jgi:hypothetical protein
LDSLDMQWVTALRWAVLSASFAGEAAAQPGVHQQYMAPPMPSLEIQRAQEAVARPEELMSLGKRAAGRLAANTVALRLYHTGIQLDWDLDLEQRPTELGEICQQVVLTWTVGPISAVREEDRNSTPLIEMAVWRRFHRLRDGEKCAEIDPTTWTRAQNYSDYHVVSANLEELRQLETEGRLSEVLVYCREVLSIRCKEPLERLRAFLKGPVTRASIENQEAVATSDVRLERLVIERRDQRLRSVEVQDMNPIPPFN